MTTKPLEGIRVVELSTMVATPSCGRLLAYLGAEVVKIESLDGEPYRQYGGRTNNNLVIFDLFNSQKKSISVNAKDPEVNEYVLKLIKTADVFLTNVREKSLERLGFSYDKLSKIHPGLVYAHFSGYGATGPMKDLPGYDLTAFFARFGILHEFVDPSHEPVNIIPGLGDMACGMALALNIVSALLNRTKTGKGEKVECALNQVGAWMMLMPMAYAQYGESFQRKSGSPPADIGNDSAKCKDGEYILYAAGTIPQWKNLCRALGLHHLIDDPRFRTSSDLFAHGHEVYEEVCAAFLQYDAEEWVHILRENDVPCERHRHLIEISTDEQLLANRYLCPLSYEDKTITVPVPPIDFDSVDLFTEQEKGAEQGQHTKEVLRSLGCPEETIEKMLEKGVIIAP